MSDREALAAALDHCRPAGYPPELLPIFAAARERLAQLPEKCGTCGGSGFEPDASTARGTPFICPTCHGSGKLYPAELVERIAKVLTDSGFANFQAAAVAVLDALNEAPE